MSSIAQRANMGDPAAASLRSRARPGGALIAADLFALLGVLLVGVSLFLHGWIHARIVFASPGQAASRILQVVGVDVNQELTRIADREIASALPPTLWQYGGHAFQGSFALFVVAAMLLVAALAFPRVRVAAQAGALLACVGAIGVIVAALLNMHQRSDSLPQRIAQAALNSPIANRAFNLTTGKPELVVGIGWPLYAAAAGVALALLGVLLGLVFAIARAARNARPIPHTNPSVF